MNMQLKAVALVCATLGLAGQVAAQQATPVPVAPVVVPTPTPATQQIAVPAPKEAGKHAKSGKSTSKHAKAHHAKAKKVVKKKGKKRH